MRLVLIRHADPDYANDALTEHGHKQAALLGEAMSDTRIDELFISPMGRANLTAAYLASKDNPKPVCLPWTHELNGNYADELWAWNYHGCDLHEDTVKWLVKVLETGREQDEFHFQGDPEPRALTIMAALQGARQIARIRGSETLSVVIQQIRVELDIES